MIIFHSNFHQIQSYSIVDLDSPGSFSYITISGKASAALALKISLSSPSNLIIDLKLLSFIKIQNARRIRLAETNSSTSQPVNSAGNRLISTIILNGLNCFIFRFPSAFASFYGFIFRYDKTYKIYILSF